MTDDVRWVVLDLGETLLDETRVWGDWADYLGETRLTFAAVMGAVIAAGGSHDEALHHFRPGADLAQLEQEKADAGFGRAVGADDLYPDALPTLESLHTQGFRTAVFANQPASARPLMDLLPVDLVATSAEWGLAKPDPAFFARVVEDTGGAAGRIAYVGDRIDNDVLPAKAAGMLAVHLRRGPWGHLQREWPRAREADVWLDDLSGLPDALARWAS